MTQQPRTPTTEAGRFFLTQNLRAGSPAMQEWIVRTEAEARTIERADLLAQIEKALTDGDHRPVLRTPTGNDYPQLECSCGWLWDDDFSVDDEEGADFLRHIALAAIRSAAPVEPPPTYRVIETLQSPDKPPSDVLRRSAAPVEPT